MQKIKKDIICHNCGTNLSGNENFCPNCGQINNKKRLSFSQYFKNLFDNFISMDSRLQRTIFLLMKNPSKLSLEYIKGKRITYTNPFRLLFNLTVLLFVLVIVFDNIFKEDIYKENKINHKILQNKISAKMDSIFENNHLDKVFKDNTVNQQTKDSLTKYLLVNAYKSVSKKNKKIIPKNLFLELVSLNQIFKKYGIKNKTDYTDKIINDFENSNYNSKLFAFSNINYKYFLYAPNQAMDSLGLSHSFSNKMVFKISKRMYKLDYFSEEEKKFAYSFLSKLGISLFLTLPLFTALLLAIYEKKSYNFTENMVFVFYLQSLFIILIIFNVFISYIFNTEKALFVVFLTFLYYLFTALKKFYQEKNLTTFVKMIFIIIPLYLFFTSLGMMLLFFSLLIFE